jgi:hypothetical protein
MGLNIEDGTGKGYLVKVNSDNEISAESVVHELQHHISRNKAEVYQVIGGSSNITAGVNTLLHITNNSSNLHIVVSYIRLQVPELDGTSVINFETYFQLGTGTEYLSNGTEAGIVNMNFSSGNVADLSAYKNKPSLLGSFTEFDRWYPDTSMMTFNKSGSIIMSRGDSLEVRLVTDQLSGVAYCRITLFFMNLSS